MSNNIVLTLNKLSKIFKGKIILNEISFEITKGDIIGIIGRVGSGKSTLLRCIAGIDQYSSGEINISTDCRIGMVFQKQNIFTNMSAIDNLCYPQQKILNRTRDTSEGISIQMLKRMNILHCFNKYPDELSNDQKQRIIIARILCLEPSLILLDNPTAPLEPENIMEMLDLIKELSSDKISIVIVSHEVRFLKAFTNRMIFINNGTIDTLCNTQAFFAHDHNKILKEFLHSISRY